MGTSEQVTTDVGPVDEHHAVLRDLVDVLIEAGESTALDAWAAIPPEYRPARTIESLVRAAELKSLPSLTAPTQ